MTVQLLQANIRLGESLFLVRGDGAQLEVSPASASPFAAFYQTVTVSDSTLPQEPILDFDPAGFTVTDVPGTTSTHVVNKATAQAILAQTPFRATLYVDPNFVGSSTGASCAPFHTIADAFTFAVASGFTSTIIFVPPGINIAANIVFPATGGNWEIAAQEGFITSTSGAHITGDITVDSSAGAVNAYRLTNLGVVGNISGIATVTGELVLTSVRHVGTLSLTRAGGNWVLLEKGIGGPSANKTGGSSSAAITADAYISAQNWVFEGAITEGTGAGPFNPPLGSSWRCCQFGANTGVAVSITLNAAAGNASFMECQFNGPVTFTTTAGYVINVDGVTMASLMAQGVTLVGGGVLKTINANNASALANVVNNVGSTALGGRNAAGLYEILFDATLLVAGTLGALQLNAIYTDLTGTLVTVPVGGTLNIAAAVGTKSQGSLSFQHNGAAPAIAFSVTGIVTPGAMSVALAVALRRTN